MGSLKAYAATLARLLGTTAATLYERQRELVRSGQLAPISGRGPGSGTKMSVEAVAKLTLAAMVSDRLSEVAERTRELAAARPSGFGPIGGQETETEQCPLTGTATFLEAFVLLLEPEPEDRDFSLLGILVSRTATRAELIFRRLEETSEQRVKFGVGDVEEPALGVFATLKSEALREIAKDLADMSEANAEQVARSEANAA